MSISHFLVMFEGQGHRMKLLLKWWVHTLHWGLSDCVLWSQNATVCCWYCSWFSSRNCCWRKHYNSEVALILTRKCSLYVLHIRKAASHVLLPLSWDSQLHQPVRQMWTRRLEQFASSHNSLTLLSTSTQDIFSTLLLIFLTFCNAQSMCFMYDWALELCIVLYFIELLLARIMGQYYFCWLSSVVVCNVSGGRAGRPPGAWTVERPTLHGGPVVLRPVKVTPCIVSYYCRIW